MRRLVTIAVLACLPAATAVVLVTRPDRAEPAPAVRPAAATPAAAGAIPLHFEENAGQAPSWARFVARGAGPPVLLGTSEAVVLADEPVRIRLRTQASPEVEGEGPLPARIDYYRGSDPAAWITGVRAYAGVGYRGVYPGVDLRYHALHGSLEHDFLVAPGADPAQIALELLGGRGVRIERGDLVVRTGLGEVRLHAPVAYQDLATGRLEIPARFVLDGRTVRFDVARYDTGKPLVIDPVLTYSTYLGGSAADVTSGLGADGLGRVYATGRTGSTDFPPGSTDPGGNDAYLVKVDPAVSGAPSLLYAAYLGGAGADEGLGLAVTAAGRAYLTGKTASADFPTTPSGFDTTAGGQDAFLLVVDPSLPTPLVYGTFLGGSGDDAGFGVAVDGAGVGHVVGETTSLLDFPVKNALDTTVAGTDGFLVAIDPAAAGVAGHRYGSYLGGDATDSAKAVAVNATGQAVVTGETTSATGFPLANAFDGTLGGAQDAFLLRLDTTAAGAASLLYGTYLGGAGTDGGAGVALTPSGQAILAGDTGSADFPFRNAIDSTLGGAQDAAAARIDPAVAGDASLVWSTVIGGTAADQSTGVAVDAAGNSYLTGLTASTDFPVTPDRVQPDQADTDAFLVKLSSEPAPAVLYASYVGGSTGGSVTPMPFDRANAIAVSPAGAASIGGETFSTNVASAGGGFDPTCGSDADCNGGAQSDGWLATTAFRADLGLAATAPAGTTPGAAAALTFTVSSSGPDIATAVALTASVPAGATPGTPAASQGACSLAGQVLSCALGRLAGGASASVTLPVTAGAPGTFSVPASVSALEADPAAANNAAAAQLVVGVSSPPATAVKPAVAFGAKRSIMVAAGKVPLSLRCPTGVEGPCAGSVVIQTAGRIDPERILGAAARKRVVKLGTARFTIPAGTTRTVRVGLNKTAKLLLAELRSLQARATVTSRDAAGRQAVTTRKLKLVAKKKAKPKQQPRE
jgi:hypothetical protein